MAKYNSKNISLALLKANMELFKNIPVFQVIFLSAFALVDSIITTDNRRLKNAKSVKGNKESDQDALAQQALAITSVIRSYASFKKDKALNESMRFTRKELFYGQDNLLTQCCSLILEKVKELADELANFGITPTLIDQYEKLMESYSESVHAPRMSIAERKEAGQQVIMLLKESELVFKEQIDPLVLLLKESNPSFYYQYQIRRKVINPATHKTKAKGIISNKQTGLALNDAEVLVDGTDLKTASDADGAYMLNVPAVKLVTLTISKQGFKTLKVEAVVKKGKVTELNVALEPL